MSLSVCKTQSRDCEWLPVTIDSWFHSNQIFLASSICAHER